MAQRGTRRARGKGLVHVHEVQRRHAERLLDRAGDVEGQAPAPRRGELEDLADRQDRWLVTREQLIGPLGRGADGAPRFAHPGLGLRRRHDRHPVAAAVQLARHVGDEVVDLVPRLPRVRRDVNDREALGHRR